MLSSPLNDHVNALEHLFRRSCMALTYTVWCNQVGTVFAEMSSRRAITRRLGRKATFLIKYMKSICIRILVMGILIFIKLYKNAMLRRKSSTQTLFYEFLVVECCISLNMNFFQSLLNFKILIIKIRKYLLVIYNWSKMLSSSQYAMFSVQDDISAKTASF